MTEAPLLKGELREPGWAANSRGAAWEGKRAGATEKGPGNHRACGVGLWHGRGCTRIDVVVDEAMAGRPEVAGDTLKSRGLSKGDCGWNDGECLARLESGDRAIVAGEWAPGNDGAAVRA